MQFSDPSLYVNKFINEAPKHFLTLKEGYSLNIQRNTDFHIGPSSEGHWCTKLSIGHLLRKIPQKTFCSCSLVVFRQLLFSSVGSNEATSNNGKMRIPRSNNLLHHISSLFCFQLVLSAMELSLLTTEQKIKLIKRRREVMARTETCSSYLRGKKMKTIKMITVKLCR